MLRVRSVSGHVSPARCLKPVPLRSRRITGVHRYYGHLRLPDITALFLASYTCPRVRRVLRLRRGLLGYRTLVMSGSTRSTLPGGLRRLALASTALLPAGVLKPSARSNTVFSGLEPSRSASPVTIAPRLLSCLRIKRAVTGQPARLDTWPVASGYQGGIHTARSYGLAKPQPRPDPALLLPQRRLTTTLSASSVITTTLLFECRSMPQNFIMASL